MNKTYLLIALAGLTLLQCSKKGGQSKPDLSKGLMAYFPFDNEIYDSTDQVQVGSLGIKTFGKDRNGKDKSAIVFDSAYISFKCFGWAANPLSISVWIVPKNVNYNNYFLKSEQGIFGMRAHVVQSVGWSYGMEVTNITTNAAMAPAPVGWVHVVSTYDGEDIKTYIDGELKSTMHHPGQTGGTNRVYISNITNPTWKGSLDDLRFYNRILSDEEILLLSKK